MQKDEQGMASESTEKKPVIQYPCSWVYTVIGSSRAGIDGAVREIFQERPCNVTASRTSAGGAYCSIRVESVVYSDKDRVELFNLLCAHDSIKIVL